MNLPDLLLLPSLCPFSNGVTVPISRAMVACLQTSLMGPQIKEGREGGREGREGREGSRRAMASMIGRSHGSNFRFRQGALHSDQLRLG